MDCVDSFLSCGVLEMKRTFFFLFLFFLYCFSVRVFPLICGGGGTSFRLLFHLQSSPAANGTRFSLFFFLKVHLFLFVCFFFCLLFFVGTWTRPDPIHVETCDKWRPPMRAEHYFLHFLGSVGRPNGHHEPPNGIHHATSPTAGSFRFLFFSSWPSPSSGVFFLDLQLFISFFLFSRRWGSYL